MENIISEFQIKGAPVQYSRFGCGHINETYLVACDSGLTYILQRINKSIFTQPEQLMENITAVTEHLAKNAAEPDAKRKSMHLVKTCDGRSFYVDEKGEYWRMYDFVYSTVCLQKAESKEDFYYSGLAFGRFQEDLSDFPAKMLHEPIADFHNTPVRYQQLHSAIEKNFDGRLALCEKEVEFALSKEREAGAIVEKLKTGELPLRVTHNDTKLNNILFDYETRKPLCIIDLDTVMPGSLLYDFGDSIRFGASSAPEDEKDLNKVYCDMELFRAFTEGFLQGCSKNISPAEVQMLPMGAKLMTLECGIRFLADYLNGDTYFRTHYPEQNLDRCRTQFKLVADMESKLEEMKEIVQSCWKLLQQ